MTKSLLTLAAISLAGASVGAAQNINGAGATFPNPIYTKWFGEYHAAHPTIAINYQSLGSGAGIQQLTAGTVDFGASDVPMTDEQISKLPVKAFHFPTVMGAVVPTYNLPGVTQVLKFSPETLSGIFLGTITKWNDPKLAKDNAGVKLPNADIVVVHRSDASGTSFVWTDYLSKISPDWKSKVGAAAAVSWPVGVGGKGNEGVSGTVKQTPNSIGYVELIYAANNKMAYGSVKNAAGAFVTASTASVTEAAAGAAKAMPADFRVSITNAPGNGSYPISSFTWLLVPSKFADANKGKAIRGFIQWMLADGQKEAAAMYYAPLPKEVVAKELAQLKLVQ
jgi:phosphate transport system substrate-binding protein